MKIREKNGSCEVIELEHGDEVQLIVPASLGLTCVYLEVDEEGKLSIAGGASVISEIIGEGMRNKFK
ncbi:MAG: hypothetical protein WC022_03360 [Parcubacteria group bacterium]